MKNVKKVTAKPAAVKQVEMKPKAGEEAKVAHAKPMALKVKQASVSNAATSGVATSAAKPAAKAASAPQAVPQVAKLAAKAAPRRSAPPEAEPVLETVVVEVAEEVEVIEAPAELEAAGLPEAVAGLDSPRPAPHVGPPPRPPAPLEIFTEGDHVVYPTHGVGKVERIVTETIAGYQLELIHITFEENRMTLRVPVEKARSAGLRKLASRQLFEAALATLKGRARIKRTMWSRRAQEYEAKINSGDPLAIAEVVRDLHRNAGQPDQSFSERQIYEAAMDRLAAELAALDQTDKATAAEKLTIFLRTTTAH